MSSERLISEVWPERCPAGPINLVSVYVHRLRRLIGDAEGKLLITRAPGYQLLAVAEDMDASGLRSWPPRAGSHAGGGFPAGRRVARRGPRPLAGQPGADRRAGHRPWSAPKPSGLEESRVEAVELRIHADLGCGRQAQVVAELHRLLAEHRFREELWALLMRALSSLGRQAEALEAYAQAREVIAEELGVDPSAELQQLTSGSSGPTRAQVHNHPQRKPPRRTRHSRPPPPNPPPFHRAPGRASQR